MTIPARDAATQTGHYPKSLRWLSAAASAALLILIALGGVVRVTGSGLGCPGWPLCYGGLLPPAQVTAIIEFSHRLMAVVASSLIVALGVIAALYFRRDRSILTPALAACGVLVVQVALGAITVFLELSPAVVAIHLGTGLILLGCVLTLTTHILAAPRPSMLAQLPPALAPLALAVMGSIFVVVVLGAIVTARDASLACDGWPLCGSRAVITPGEIIQMAHRLAVLASSILMAWLVVGMWRVRSALPAAWSMTVNLAGLFAAQALIGGLNVFTHLAVVPRGAHIAFGSMVWGLAVVVAILVLRQEAPIAAGRRQRGVDPAPSLGFHHGQSG